MLKVAEYLEKAAFEAEASADMASLATQLDKSALSALLEGAWSRASTRLKPEGVGEAPEADADKI